MIKRPQKIFFIGCVESSDVALQTLLTMPEVEVCGVLTRKKSNFNSDFIDLSQRAKASHIPYFYADDLSQNSLISLLKGFQLDTIYCIGWSTLLSNEVLNTSAKSIVGFHPAALPQNRGRHPIIWSLVLGLEKTASTFFLMSENPDCGPIIDQIDIDINLEDNATSLYKKILLVIPDQVKRIATGLYDGRLEGNAQDSSKASTWRKRDKSDGIIDWRMPSEGIHNLVRALSKPYPGAQFKVENTIVRVLASEVLNDNIQKNIEPGRVLQGGDTPIIRTGTGAIRLTEIEPNIFLKKGSYL